MITKLDNKKCHLININILILFKKTMYHIKIHMYFNFKICFDFFFDKNFEQLLTT